MVRRGRLPVHHAVALGLVQGPAELVPVSSSGHVLLLPALLGWPYGRLDPPLRKAFEVALHAGAAAGLAVVLRDELADLVRTLDRRRAALLALATAPPSAVGLLLRRPVEARLSAPRPVAAAQIVAGAALGLADRRPTDRHGDDAGAGDAVAIGAAQAASLAPGVSRAGAVLIALRLRRFDRRSAAVMSRQVGAPLMLAAAALQAVLLARGGLLRPLVAPFLAGAGAAFVSTLASAPLLRAMDSATSYAGIAGYRVALGAVTLARLRCAGRSG
jgi:undecaprenyl-diphosphatase